MITPVDISSWTAEQLRAAHAQSLSLLDRNESDLLPRLGEICARGMSQGPQALLPNEVMALVCYAQCHVQERGVRLLLERREQEDGEDARPCP